MCKSPPVRRKARGNRTPNRHVFVGVRISLQYGFKLTGRVRFQVNSRGSSSVSVSVWVCKALQPSERQEEDVHPTGWGYVYI